MVKELRKLETNFGIDLAASVEYRINERRLAALSTLQAYLENPHFIAGSLDDPRVLTYANKTAITTLAKDIYIRLFGREDIDEEVIEENSHEGNSGSDADATPPPPKKSRSFDRSNDLRDFKATRTSGYTPAPIRTTSSSRVLAAIKSDMKYFEANGKRPEKLDQVTI